MARSAYVRDFTVRCGVFTADGKLMSVRKSERRERLRYCTLPDANAVFERYVDAEGNLYTTDELGRAKVVKKDGKETLVPVNHEAVAEAKASRLPLNTITLTAHPVKDVERYLFPAKNNGYIFLPQKVKSDKVVEDPHNDEMYHMIRTVVTEAPLVFLGKCNLAGYEGLFRFFPYRDHIVLQKMLYPEDLNELEAPPAPKKLVTKAAKAKALKIVDTMVKPFDPTSYEDEITERLAEAVEQEFDPNAPVTTRTAVPAPVEGGIDLDALLAAALADAS